MFFGGPLANVSLSLAPAMSGLAMPSHTLQQETTFLHAVENGADIALALNIPFWTQKSYLDSLVAR
jgi:hypothetical protein